MEERPLAKAFVEEMGISDCLMSQILTSPLILQRPQLSLASVEQIYAVVLVLPG